MTKEQQEVQTAIENVIRLASRYKVAITGFAFSANPPMLMNFGNCTDTNKLALYKTLVEMTEKKVARGETVVSVVGELN